MTQVSVGPGNEANITQALTVSPCSKFLGPSSLRVAVLKYISLFR